MRLTHEQIEEACGRAQRKGRDMETICPLCGGGHLQLFGEDEFACQQCHDSKRIAAWIYKRLGLNDTTELTKEPGKPQEGNPTGKLTLVEYCMEKHLPVQWLIDFFGARDGTHPYYPQIETAVCFPYWNEEGEEVTCQWRWGMGKKERRFLAKKPTYLYGGRFLQCLEQMAAAGHPRDTIFLSEGESNPQTLALSGFPAFGIPGVTNWNPEWAKLKCFELARWIYVFLDMRDGLPEDIAIIGARRIAESFSPGKVMAVKLPTKDISALWLYHMVPREFDARIGLGAGQEGFVADVKRAIMEARPIIPVSIEVEGLPPDLGIEIFDACPILKDFVEMTLPRIESDINNLTCDFLAAAGAIIGRRAFMRVLADEHTPATFHLLIGNTSIGKGTSWGAVTDLYEKIAPDWRLIIRRSARSQQSLFRMIKAVSEAAITEEEDGKKVTRENPNYTQGRMLIRFAEVSSLFKGMRAEWSTMSQALREVYDGTPLSNELAKEGDSEQFQVNEPYTIGLLGDITPWELTETIQNVDFSNGVANRFVWCHARKTKTLAHPPLLPDYTDIAERLKAVMPTRRHQLAFSEGGSAAWEAWVLSLPLEESGRLGSACGRMRPNALRIAILFAVLDEARMVLPGQSILIEATHVRGAAIIMDRHKATVAWFLDRPAKIPPTLPDATKTKMWHQTTKVRAALKNGRITGNELYILLKHMSATERKEVALATGLKEHQEIDLKGNKFTVWTT